MDAHEAIALREQLGLTTDRLAAELGITPNVVSAWERASIRVPGRIAAELRWRAAIAERDAALATCDLPECTWLDDWSESDPPSGLQAQTEHYKRAAEHQASCPACQARSRFLHERFGPLPPRPKPWWLPPALWVGDRIRRLPKWGQSAATFAIAFGVYSLIRIFFALPTLKTLDGWTMAVGGLLLSLAVGALVGAVVGLIRERAR
jgi:transcriptional regulator with XRE-family HTH domain